MSKKVLIVFAHQSRNSFNGALLEASIEALKAQGHEVTVSDLHQMNWNPIVGPNDIDGGVEDLDNFNYGRDTAKAAAENRLSEDIRAEQAKLDAADLVIFQFPLYWMGFPAILKGWFDRIMCLKYAWDIPAKVFEYARFSGKKCMLSFSTGGPKNWFDDDGMCGDMNVSLWPIQSNILRFIGFDVLPPQIFYGMSAPSREGRQALIDEYKTRMAGIFKEKPVYFCKMTDYTPKFPDRPQAGMVLKDSKRPAPGGVAPSVGQHCGHPLPPNQMLQSE